MMRSNNDIGAVLLPKIVCVYQVVDMMIYSVAIVRL